MKIMVTGSDGQLGSELVRQIGNEAFPVPHTVLDITRLKDVQRFFQFEQPDVIVNCAAYTQVNKAEFRGAADCYKVNTAGVACLLSGAAISRTLVIQISTDYVFDGYRMGSYTERSSTNPLNIYGKSKQVAEKLVREYEYGYILRTSGLFASGYKNFVTNILAQAKSGEVIKAVHNQFAHLTYVPHLAASICWFIMNRPPQGTYHIVNRGIESWYDYARHIVQLSHCPATVQPVSASEFGGAKRPDRTELSMIKYEETRGNRIPRWETGLREFFERETNGSSGN